VPTQIRIREVIRLGYPAKWVPQRFRGDPRDFTHIDKFGASKHRMKQKAKDDLSTRAPPHIHQGVRKPKSRIAALQERCTGCRTCEIVCAYHHKKVFSREISSVFVRRIERRGEFEVTIYEERKNGRLPCDVCINEKQPLCVRFCPPGALVLEWVRNGR